MKIEATPASAATLNCDLLVLGASGPDADSVSQLQEHYPGLTQVLKDRRFKGKSGTSVLLPGLTHLAARDLLVVGTGDGGDEDVQNAASHAGKKARAQHAKHVGLSFQTCSTDVLEHLDAGNYVFDKYKSEDGRTPAIEQVSVVGGAPTGDLGRSAALMEARRMTRDLVNGPPADIYPETLADAARELSGIEHLEVEVWDFERCRKENCVGIIAVGQGSVRPGCLIHLRYRPPGAKAHVALVGKGVTFDAGGLSLKPSSGMQTMRCDMAGAATMLGVARAAAEQRLPIAMDTFLGAVENMVDGNSYKLGDVLTYPNGVTVEIHNTDAEGRLVLADCLIRACQVEGVTHVVDAATLTGACVVAIGDDYTALFTSDDDLASDLHGAADQANEGLWRLPLHKPYNAMLKSDYAQIKNVGGRAAGATTAALFLQHFVTDEMSWAHLDIAGSAFHDKGSRRYAAGGTGEMVRSLTLWLQSLSEG